MPGRSGSTPIRDPAARLEQFRDCRLEHVLIQAQPLEDRSHLGFKACIARTDHPATGIDEPQITRERQAIVEAGPLTPVSTSVNNRQQPKPRFLRGISGQYGEVVTQRFHCPVGLTMANPGSQRRVR